MQPAANTMPLPLRRSKEFRKVSIQAWAESAKAQKEKNDCVTGLYPYESELIIKETAARTTKFLIV